MTDITLDTDDIAELIEEQKNLLEDADELGQIVKNKLGDRLPEWIRNSPNNVLGMYVLGVFGGRSLVED